ncbi:MAG: hypothetical protein ACK5GN_08435 [Pseudomonadota bacterium]|jgi:hypothetical protein
MLLTLYRKDSMGWLFASNANTNTAMQEVHSQVRKNDHSLPEGAILLGVLKAIEKELQRRGLLGAAAEHAMPLWFLAETERNVFLWRNGKSIGDYHEFNFWVDVPALITKRRRHLSRCNGFNPFVCASPSETGVEHELRYLDQIEDLADSVFHKASVVSRASDSLRGEIEPTHAFRTLIVLPYRPDSGSLQGSSETV